MSSRGWQGELGVWCFGKQSIYTWLSDVEDLKVPRLQKQSAPIMCTYRYRSRSWAHCICPHRNNLGRQNRRPDS
jgi:hypothetical protein